MSESPTIEATIHNDNVRYHDMDNLRALAMLLGIFFHASLAYSPMLGNLWLATNQQSSQAMEYVAFFTHIFRMPLFFVIAGFFTLMMIEKRGVKGLLKNRAKRILLPFVIFLPLVMIAVIAGVAWALKNIENLPPMLSFIESLMKNPNAEQPPFSTMHLWFLFNLSWFYLIALACYKLNLHKHQWLAKLMTPKFILGLLPLLMVPAMLTQTAPHPAAERIYPELWSLGFYGLFFLFGFALFKHQQLIQQLEKLMLPLLFISIVGYSAFYYLLPESVSIKDMMALLQDGVTLTTEHVIVVVLECYVAVYMTLVCIIAAKKWLNRQSKVFRYIADSSYWVYIIHVPVLFFVQYQMINTPWDLWIEFLISSFATLLIGIVTYAIFIRPTPIGTLLNGQRKKVI